MCCRSRQLQLELLVSDVLIIPFSLEVPEQLRPRLGRIVRHNSLKSPLVARRSFLRSLPAHAQVHIQARRPAFDAEGHSHGVGVANPPVYNGF
jgi:hypothetical protein